MSKDSCKKCGAPIAQSEVAGRPKTYCGHACRRAAELEVRRIDARLGRLEGELMQTRLNGYLSLTKPGEIEAEIERQESRLRELLAGLREAE